ncbi:MAG: hypothetical protein ACYCX2_06150 [Christensenellales bacterium]
MRKLTPRESFLLYLLFLFALISVSMQFLIFPLVTGNADLTLKIAEQTQAKTLMEDMKSNKTAIENDLAENKLLLEDEIQAVPYVTNDEEIVTQFTKLIQANGLSARSVKFMDNGEPEEEPFGKEILARNLTISIEGDKFYFVRLLNALENMPNISINNLSSDFSQPIVNHMVTLTYFMVK